ncbi:MAG: hypothetical protein ACYCT9_07495 [Leptospirillum sp.]|jgi:hypothetical protein
MTLKEEAAQKWFGYGQWSHPYWFIGMEQGGEDDKDHIGWEKAWKELGGSELIDCREHHQKMGERGNDRWHGPFSRLQNTWGPLIKLLLSFKHPEKTVELEVAKEYQRTQWGSNDGETVVAEVLGTRTQFLNKENDLREIYKAPRIKIFKDRLCEFSPLFVVFYGRGYLDIHEQIIGQRFQMDSQDFAGFTWIGKTLCIHVKHPVARGIRGQEWTELGKEIKKRVVNGPPKNI